MVAFEASGEVSSFWMYVHVLLPGGSQNQAVAHERLLSVYFWVLGERSLVFICWRLVEGSILPLQQYANKVYLGGWFLWWFYLFIFFFF